MGDEEFAEEEGEDERSGENGKPDEPGAFMQADHSDEGKDP